MKAMKFLGWLCLCLILAGCTGDRIRGFMPGTYINATGGEFSIASDTLEVAWLEGDSYQVFRRTGYNILRDGKVGPREYGTEVWSCAYSAATKSLTERRMAKVITFFPDSDELRVGSRVYKKIR